MKREHTDNDVIKINYDEDYEDKAKFNLNLNFNKKYIIFGILLLLLIILVICFFFFKKNNKTDYYIELDGSKEITVYQNEEYTEPGYFAYDENKNDVTEKVIVKENIDTSSIGQYTVTYTLKDTVVERKINVIEKKDAHTYIYLKGDLTIYLKANDKFEDPGYIVIDTVDSNLTDEVVVNSNLNPTKPGNYYIVYSVVNSSGVTTKASRVVVVLGSDITLSLSNSNMTSDSVNINVKINDNYFDYLILPNGNKITSNEYSYKVTKNDTYTFTSYDKFGTKTQKSITVSNIVANNTKPDSSGSSSGGTSGSTDNSNTTKPPVTKIDVPKITISDNIASGEKHKKAFTIGLTANKGKIYYCEDTTNSCNPTSVYKDAINYSTTTTKYLRYKACDGNNCSDVGNYRINLVISTIKKLDSLYYYNQFDYSLSFCKSSTIASSGCGITSFAMVASSYAGKKYSMTEIRNWFCDLRGWNTDGGMGDYWLTHEKTLEHFNLEYEMLFDYTDNYSSYNGVSVYGTTKYSEEDGQKILNAVQEGKSILIGLPKHWSVIGPNSKCSKDQVYFYNPAGSSYNGCYTPKSLFNNVIYNYKGRCNNIISTGSWRGYWCGWDEAIAYWNK